MGWKWNCFRFDCNVDKVIISIGGIARNANLTKLFPQFHLIAFTILLYFSSSAKAFGMLEHFIPQHAYANVVNARQPYQ